MYLSQQQAQAQAQTKQQAEQQAEQQRLRQQQLPQEQERQRQAQEYQRQQQERIAREASLDRVLLSSDLSRNFPPEHCFLSLHLKNSIFLVILIQLSMLTVLNQI